MVTDERTMSISEAPAIGLSTAIHAPLAEHRDEPNLGKSVQGTYKGYV